MGIASAFRFASEVATNSSRGDRTGRPAPVIRSPWSANTLSTIVWSDIFDEAPRIPSRADAMSVPAIAKGRALIVGTLARQPLAKFRRDAKVTPEPWMYRTNTRQSPRARMLWTLDDIIFGGASLWAVQRGARDVILDAVRVLPEEWEVDEDLSILVHGTKVSAEEVILFEGPQDGLLQIGARTIAAALAMERAWADRVEHPAPPAALTGTDPNSDLTPEEAKELTKAWDEARRAGGTSYAPSSVKVEWPTTTAADLYVNGRNALRLDVANFLALPASLLEGSTATASLTYSTKEGSRNELVDYSLAFWANPIEARLSQDDVVAAGSRVAFDLEYLSTPTQPAQAPALED